ncbi:MAG: hypothetical protein FWD33_01595 [Alphaproteobacteria bacterium]|nr:hypothetical protein [Alphaproteobacteria bacterium]
MNKYIKTLSMITAVAAIAVGFGGCHRSHDRGKRVEYVQTHQGDEVTRVRARMFQKRDHKTEMGHITFAERESGLRMHMELKDLRPNTEYQVVIYDMSDCKIDKKKWKEATKEQRAEKRAKKTKNCEKVNMRATMPTLKSTAKGEARTSFLITGLTAAELDGAKIVLRRENAQGEEISVGWGMLRERSFLGM